MSRLTCLVVLALGLGCGGDGDGAATCETFSSCGGDPVGSWRVTATCLTGISEDEEVFLEQCPGGDFSISAETTGEFTIRQDGTFDYELTLTNDIAVGYSPDCTAGLTSCEQIDDACTGDPQTGCDCAFSKMSVNTQTNEEWTTNGSTLLLDGVDWAYCVQGNRMALQFDEEGGLVYTFSFTRQ